MYRRLATWCFTHGAWVLAAWIALLAGVNIGASAIGSAFSAEFSIPDSESARGIEILEESFPGAGGAFGGSIVVKSDGSVDRAEVRAPLEELFARVDEIGGVGVVSPFSPIGAAQVSPDRTIAFAEVALGSEVDQTAAADIGAKIVTLLPEIPGTVIEVGGQALTEFEPPASELIGIAFAIVILILAFGSVLSMGLPIGVALAGVGTGGLGLVSLLSNGVGIPDFAPFVGIMIGLGVGIDYALFIVTRYRELTAVDMPAAVALADAMHTAGRAVVFAGLTVVFSLLGLLVVGVGFVGGLGIAAAATVAVTLVASITLLPALIGLAHTKMEITRWRGLVTAAWVAVAALGAGLKYEPLIVAGAVLAGATLLASVAIAPLRAVVPTRPMRPLRETLAYRWSHLIQRRPWTFVLAGMAALLALTAPVTSLRLGFADEGNLPEDTSARRAYDIIAEGFGPGFNGPMLVVATSSSSDATAVETALGGLVSAIGADAGVAAVTPPFPSPTNGAGASSAWLVRVIPTTSPQDAATVQLVDRLRSEVIGPTLGGTEVEARVTGAVPGSIDFTSYLADRTVAFFAAVLGVSFLLLMMVFRSILVPLKAVFMNVLSISAAYGVVVVIFQWGWLGGIFGVEPAPIEPFVPMMLFAIVFGLSMDYEVFLLSRIKEEYDRTGDAMNSVADGLAATARVISAAAAIMVVVFGAFLLEDERVIKLFGVGLAVAVLLDATIVRMVLVPATMELLGGRNWWIPRWLDRVLPRLHV
jgi:RND superfamily putative drug exporter